MSLPRNEGVGSVAVYFTPGGANYVWKKPDTKDSADNGLKFNERYYVAHTVWFHNEKKDIVRPDKLPDTSDVPIEQYKAAFPVALNCGGETIEKIKEAGNAFSFATKTK
jgi:hypothetical protein